MAKEHTPYLNFLARQYAEDDDSFVIAAERVAELLDSPGWKVVTELVEDARTSTATNLIMSHAGSQGKVLEQAEYARLCGYLAGAKELQVAAESFALALEAAKRRRDT